MVKLRKRKMKDGDYQYFVDFYHNGKRIRRSTGTSNYQTAKMIQKEIELRLVKENFKIEDLRPSKRTYLKEFISEFLEFAQSHKAYSTVKRDDLSLRGLLEFCGNVPLDSIDKKLLDQFLGERTKTLKRTTVNIDLRHIKAAFTKAVDWGYIERNPAKGIKPLPVPQSAPKFLTELQLSQLKSVIDFQPIKEIVIFAANTGVRIGELVNIKWTDIDFEKMTVRISQKDDFQTKSKRERTIPLNEAAYEVLAGLERKGEYVFCRLDGKKRDKHFITRRFKEYLRIIGLDKGFSFHSLRHTFASHLVQKGVSIYIVQKLLGHANIKTTEVYAYLAPEKYHDVVSLLGTDQKVYKPIVKHIDR